MTQRKIDRVLRMQRCMVQWCEHTVTVRRIGKAWHCRVFVDGVLNQEVKVYDRMDIGFACRDMLRMEDKCGNWSDFAMSARTRQQKDFQ